MTEANPHPDDANAPIDPPQSAPVAQPSEDETPDFAARLGGSKVGLRPELDVSRHVFRGQVSYVVRDPITFESHRFSEADYKILTALHADHSLAEVFARMVNEGKLELTEEEEFYRFVISLHRLGFLNLPIPDGKRLYQRFLMKEQQRRMKRWMMMFFYQLPLVNPDHFLGRTVRFVKPLFTPTAVFLWATLVTAAIYVATRRWDDLTDQVGEAFGAQNLPILWLTIIGLKFFHEFGHAYATKAFGGHVPEMGAYLIVFTPCAYVDASAAWGFPKRIQRMFVGFAGMYFELAIAAIAMLAWAATEPGTVNSLLFNVVMLASVVTVGFNINPLMRFDGYYVLSDALEIPNLRQRSTAAMTAIAKRIAIGPRVEAQTEDGMKTQLTLCGFGVFAALYRITVIVSISMLVASKFYLLGLILAATYLTIEILKLLRRVLLYLWFSEEAQQSQIRSFGVSLALIAVAGYALFGVPLPGAVHASGSVGTEGDQVIRLERPGFIAKIHGEAGKSVIAGELIAELRDPDLLGEIIEARSSLVQSSARAQAYRTIDLPTAQQEQQTVEYFRDRLAERERRLEAMTMRADSTGWIARCLPPEQAGRFLPAGEEIATIAAGRFTVVTYLSPREMAAATPRPGEVIQFRPAGSPSERLSGLVLRVEPVASTRIDEISLTQLAGGPIQVDPDSRRAEQSYFRVISVLEPSTYDGSLRHGLTGSIRIGAASEPMALLLWRRVLVFLNRLDVG